MRTNVYKNKILKLLEEEHLLSIADIHKHIVGVDYSTVYRNIEQLVSNHQVRRVVFGKGNILYELNRGEDNHDHFLCLGCGTIEDIHVPLEGLPLSSKHIISDLVVRGICKHCNQ
jgi:Fe2+ or Zn2+ uptake regulation protein